MRNVYIERLNKKQKKKDTKMSEGEVERRGKEESREEGQMERCIVC